MKKYLIIFLSLLLCAKVSYGATAWVPQEGLYEKFISTKGKPKYIKLSGVKAVTADAVIVRAGEKVVPIDAEIVQAGYKQVPIDTVITEGMIVPLECEAKFYCDTTFGVIFDLTKNTALHCPKAFIKKNEALLFDAAISIDNQVTCAR